MNRCSILLAIAWLGLIGCDGQTVPNVRYGKDACDHCRMIINDHRFATAVTLTNGDVQKFDDTCCLIDFLAVRSAEVKQSWVRSYDSDEWYRADDAYFVFGPQLQTPMASGLAAVKTPDQAKALSQTWGGKALRFGELPTFFADRKRALSHDETTPNHNFTELKKE